MTALMTVLSGTQELPNGTNRIVELPLVISRGTFSGPPCDRYGELRAEDGKIVLEIDEGYPDGVDCVITGGPPVDHRSRRTLVKPDHVLAVGGVLCTLKPAG